VSGDLVRGWSSWFGRSSRQVRVGCGLLLALVVPSGVEHARAQEPPIEISEVVHAGRLSQPAFFSLALDAQGNVYVGGTQTSNVLRLPPRGDAPGDTTDDSGCTREILSIGFAAPRGIAVASDGTVYVNGTGNAEVSNDNVVRVSPDGTITELVNRGQLSRSDWNPSGIAIDEAGAAGTFVYAAGPAGDNPRITKKGALVRIAPDSTAEVIFRGAGQGVALDEDTGTLYLAATDDNVVLQVPDPRTGECGQDGKLCPELIKDGDPGCDGKVIALEQPYAMAIAGGILYVTGSAAGNSNVLRRPLLDDNVLGLRRCTEEILRDDPSGIRLVRPRAIAVDASGNVYVAGGTTREDTTFVWLRPNPSNPEEVSARELEIMSDTSALDFPHGLAVDPAGSVYVSGSSTSSVAVFRVRTVTAGATCGNNKRDPDEACEYRIDCCCSVSCTPQPAGAMCRDSGGNCDRLDMCDGVSGVCMDQRKGEETVCRPSAGACDIEETCEGGLDCPPDRRLPPGTVCRPASGSCDVQEQCSDAAACPEDLGKAVGDECGLTAQDVGNAEPQCIETLGRCSASRACLPRPRLGSFCVPADLSERDRGCLVSASCDGSGRCQSTPRKDGEQCGSLCDNTECRAAKCVGRAGELPCGGKENCDDTKPPGKECVLCGNGRVDPPFEECDDGNDPPMRSDGCTAQCRFACHPDDPTSCAQPVLTNGESDPCHTTSCEPYATDPSLRNLGFACVTRPMPEECNACPRDDRECPPPKPCELVQCVENRCMYPRKEGIDLATCAFGEPFPGDGSACDTRAEKNSRKAVASLKRREDRVKGLVEGKLCVNGTPHAEALRKAVHRLKRAELLANVLRSPFQGKISMACESTLIDRFEEMRANLAATKRAGWTCPAAGPAEHR
jgi:cysteine-rich repeat protein